MTYKFKLWHAIAAMIALFVITQGDLGFTGAINGDPYPQTCNIGKLTVATVECDKGAETSETIYTSNKRTFTNYFYDAYIDVWDAGWVASGYLVDSAGHTVCSYEFLAAEPECIGYGPLNYKEVYTIKGDVDTVKYSGHSLWLYYSDSFGYNHRQISQTRDCISGNLRSNLIASGISEPAEGLLKPVQNLDFGESFVFDVAYVDIAPVGLQYYNSMAVECNQVQRTLRSYSEVDAEYGGSCWLLPDKIVLQGDNTFCCDTDWCKETISSDYACENFKCVYGGTTTEGCNVHSDCGGGDAYCLLKPDGTYSFFSPYCDKTRPQPPKSGTCMEIEETGLECCPDKTYPNDQCCHQDTTGKWKLMDCEHGLKSCSQTFGADACCLDTQDEYTEQGCGVDLQCCNAEDDGIGICKETCEEKLFDLNLIIGNLAKKLMDAINNSLGIDIDLSMAKWILIGLVVIILLAIILPRSRGGFGPPGYFGPMPIYPRYPRYGPGRYF